MSTMTPRLLARSCWYMYSSCARSLAIAICCAMRSPGTGGVMSIWTVPEIPPPLPWTALRSSILANDLACGSEAEIFPRACAPMVKVGGGVPAAGSAVSATEGSSPNAPVTLSAIAFPAGPARMPPISESDEGMSPRTAWLMRPGTPGSRSSAEPPASSSGTALSSPPSRSLAITRLAPRSCPRCPPCRGGRSPRQTRKDAKAPRPQWVTCPG